MRLFVAIDCEAVKDVLVLAQKEFSSLKARLTQSFHLTLLFIGEADANECELIKEKLEAVQFRPFKLQLSQLGTFTSYSQRVIWCGVNESKPLIKLQQRINKAINGENTVIKYSPHITLARIKKYRRGLKANEKQMMDEGLKKEVVGCIFQVNHFVLYESTTSPKGAIYKVIKKYS
ncbi:MAG: RNA 2',3'-cyclic phosphodiesterase [Bacteroidales bacterium]|nr:RNA 2',3'-cyclic phosphodiesterase [Bacteroidales bacterium]